MKVFLAPDPGLGRAIFRVAEALAKYAPPWVEVIDQPDEADLRIWHVLGAGQRTPLLTTRQPFAAIQYTLRTSEHPNTHDWVDVWRRSLVTWAYYDLRQMMKQDGVENWLVGNLFHAPLGVDAAVFKDHHRPRRFLVGTSGYVAATEAVGEWAQVCRTTGYPQFHLGPSIALPWAHGSIVGAGMDDDQLAELWSQCNYVAAMRRVEGFELPGVEGLLCGARPVCFDQPWYRQWYGRWAEYVIEDTPDRVVEQLLALVRQPYRPVTFREQEGAAGLFNWSLLVSKFWSKVAIALENWSPYGRRSL